MRLLKVTGVLLILFAGIAAAQEKPDFSGTWNLNTDKSELGERGGRRGGRMGGGAAVISVSMEENSMTVETTRKNRDGEEVTSAATYKLDGSSAEQETNFGTMNSTASWSKDGKKLIITSTRTMSRGSRSFSMDTTETWYLKDGCLVIESTMQTPRGDRSSKRVYDKTE